MRGNRRLGKHLLALGILILGLVSVVPAYAAPLTPTAPSATDAPLANAGPPVEHSKEILGETSPDGPALWTANPTGARPALASVLAWTGTDSGHSLNILRSSDGIHYSQKTTYAQSADGRPAVAALASPATVVLAWIGPDANHTLHLLCQGAACGTSGSGTRHVTLGENSFTSPALARFGNGFLLAWTGTNSGHSLNILPFSLTTGGSGFQLGKKTILGQFSSVAQPNLAENPHNHLLLLTWAATSPANELAFATSSDGVSWSGARTIGETSTTSPDGYAVAATDLPTYWMTWTGTNAAHSVNVRVTRTFPSWPLSNNKTVLGESALGGPVLGYVGTAGQALLAWTGTDAAHHLNIATLTTGLTLDQRIDAYIATLSTSQKIGQTLMLAVYASSDNATLNQALAQWHLGSAIIFTRYNGGAVEPSTLTGLKQLVAGLKSHAQIPLLLSTDEEGGTVDRLAPYYGGTPSARQLAQTGNPNNAYAQAQTDASRMKSIGLSVDFAPVVDVDQGGGVGSSRTFGTTVSTVTTYAGAFLDGLQQHGIAGTLKHWPGLGAATGNPDNTLPTIHQTQAQMRAIDFAPFRNLLSRQPGMIMVTTVLAPAFDSKNPAMLSSVLVTTELRDDLGYGGVIVTDSLDAQGLIQFMRQQGYSNATQGIAEASVRAFLAGNDLIELPIESDRLSAVATAMTNAVHSGRISPSRLNASVHRIIALKVRMGLMTVP